MSEQGSGGILRHVAAFLGIIVGLVAIDVLVGLLRPPWWVGAVLLAGALGGLCWSAMRRSAAGSVWPDGLGARAFAIVGDPWFVFPFVALMAAEKVFERLYGFGPALLVVAACCAPVVIWANTRRKKTG